MRFLIQTDFDYPNWNFFQMILQPRSSGQSFSHTGKDSRSMRIIDSTFYLHAVMTISSTR